MAGAFCMLQSINEKNMTHCFRIILLSSDEGLKDIPFLSGTSTASPVTGLWAVLGCLLITRKVPKPATRTSSPLSSASSVISCKRSMTFFASTVVMLCLLLISLASSFLFMSFCGTTASSFPRTERVFCLLYISMIFSGKVSFFLLFWYKRHYLRQNVRPETQ